MIRRAADYFVMPLGLALMLGAIAVALAIWFGHRKSRRGVRGAIALGASAIVILYLSSIRPVGVMLMEWLERPYPLQAPEAIHPVDAVVVLGGGSILTFDDAGHQILDPGARFEASVRLYQAGRAKFIVLSGGGSKIPGDTGTEGDHLRKEALRRGVPESALVQMPIVWTTGDEMRAVAEIARARGWNRVAISTNACHMDRSLKLARAAGLDAVAFTSNLSLPPHAQPWILDWLPHPNDLARTTRAWHEILGRLVN